MIKYTCGAGTPEEAETNCTYFIRGECTASFCEYRRKKQTNADRIRAMNDEELANWLALTQYVNMMEAAEIFGAQLPFEEETLNGSEQECLQWLKQPAEGE